MEGPEHGVYFRGKTIENVISLPDYWTGLVHEETISVQLTPINSATTHFVINVEDNKVYIDSDNGDINCYFIVHAERKDVDKVLLEYRPINY